MQKRKTNQKKVIVFLIISLGLLVVFFQYASEFVGALYSTVKPADGHSWTEMGCDLGLCVTVANKVGIGTITPTQKLEVVGDIKASGTICDGEGNCLNSVSTVNESGICGPAATNYAASANAFAGALCNKGTLSPAVVVFPLVSSPSIWACLGSGNGGSTSCIASINSIFDPMFLVNFKHVVKDCYDAGGQAVDSDVSYSLCRFNAPSCPSGWSQYLSFSKTAAVTIPGRTGITCWGNQPANYSYSACNIPSHDWGNIAVESCSLTGAACVPCYVVGCNGIPSCYYEYVPPECRTTYYSTVEQIGCY